GSRSSQRLSLAISAGTILSVALSLPVSGLMSFVLPPWGSTTTMSRPGVCVSVVAMINLLGRVGPSPARNPLRGVRRPERAGRAGHRAGAKDAYASRLARVPDRAL